MKRNFGVIAVFVLAGCGSAEIEPNCTTNGFGAVSCEFHNKGTAEGSTCVKLKLTPILDEAEMPLESRAICSGIVKPNDIVERETNGGFAENPAEKCGTWPEGCSLEVQLTEEK